MSHPTPVSRVSVWLSSTPSATTRNPSAWPSSMVAHSAATSQSGDEGAIELQLVDGEAAEVSERCEACPEVVNRDAHAKIAELVDGATAAVEVADDRRLGDLHGQRRPRQSMAGQRVA